MCQQNSSVPRGAVRTQRLSCGTAPSAPPSARRAVASIAAPPSESSKRGEGLRGTMRSSKGEREAHGQSRSASSSTATRRSRRRISSTPTSSSKREPIVRSW